MNKMSAVQPMQPRLKQFELANRSKNCAELEWCPLCQDPNNESYKVQEILDLSY